MNGAYCTRLFASIYISRSILSSGGWVGRTNTLAYAKGGVRPSRQTWVLYFPKKAVGLGLERALQRPPLPTIPWEGSLPHGRSPDMGRQANREGRMTPEQLTARNDAIRLAWDDPLLRAVHGQKIRKAGQPSQYEDRNEYMRWYRKIKSDDYNAWHRAYRALNGKPRTDEQRKRNRDGMRRARKLALAGEGA